MNRFKLIQEYPGSPLLDTVIVETTIVKLGGVGISSEKTYAISCHDPNFDEGKFKVKNPEDYPNLWGKVAEPTYEILTFGFEGGNDRDLAPNGNYKITPSESGGLSLPQVLKRLSSSEYYIKTVRRLSDGQIFTIGDMITSTLVAWTDCKIKNFFLKGKELKIDVIHNLSHLTASYYLTDSLEIVKPELVLTTVDGVDLFEGDIVWGVDITDGKPFRCWLYQGIAIQTWRNGKFSSEEAALKFSVLNTKCLSVKDVISLFPLLDFESREKLEILAKSLIV